MEGEEGKKKSDPLEKDNDETSELNEFGEKINNVSRLNLEIERNKNEKLNLIDDKMFTALENNKKLVGKIVKVLNGRTEGNKPIEIINVQHPMSNKNKFVQAKVTKANIWSLKGKLL